MVNYSKQAIGENITNTKDGYNDTRHNIIFISLISYNNILAITMTVYFPCLLDNLCLKLFYLHTDYIILYEYNTVPKKYHHLNVLVFNVFILRAYFSDSTYLVILLRHNCIHNAYFKAFFGHEVSTPNNKY